MPNILQCTSGQIEQRAGQTGDSVTDGSGQSSSLQQGRDETMAIRRGGEGRALTSPGIMTSSSSGD